MLVDPHASRPGYGYVKNNRSLQLVARTRYPNNDPLNSIVYENGENQRASSA